MTRIARNTQLFALAQAPPEAFCMRGRTYRLVRVFKHDFFAATCLYEAAGAAAAADLPRLVVKFGRTRAFCGLPLAWYGRWMCRHEGAIYEALEGIEGVPRWAGRVDDGTYAIEYVDARPLDHLDAVPPGFFDSLVELFREVHERGVAYCDANKRSNILADRRGQPFLIDYQIALRRRDDWPWPLRPALLALVRYLQRGDLYHVYKHKRKLAPAELRAEEEAQSRRRGLLHTIHRKLTKPYRSVRRRFLGDQYAAGRLQSPSADLEDHPQPEKDSWRGREGGEP